MCNSISRRSKPGFSAIFGEGRLAWRLPALGIFSLAMTPFLVPTANSQDLHIKKNVTVNGYVVSTTDTSIKGARSREVSQGPAGPATVTLRQCDLHRTVTLNDQDQTYLSQEDPIAAPANPTGSAQANSDDNGGRIDLNATYTDTGERKTLFGYQARHIKARIAEESSANACTKIHQTIEIDGWYADLGKEATTCALVAPPVTTAQGCNDKIVEHHTGSKPAYPLSQTFSVPGPDGKPASVSTSVSEIVKQKLEPELFEVPKNYRQVSSMAELKGVNPSATPAAQGMPQPASQAGSQAGTLAATVKQGMLNPMAAPAANQAAMSAMQQQMRTAQGLGFGGGQMMPNMQGMPGMPQMAGPQTQPAASQIAAPQVLGPKGAGKIRIGVAPPDAQMGQGSKSGADYSTPVRNAMVALMSGPAVEIAALDSHIALQLQAEAQQKQCDYILFSGVMVKHSSGGGLGGFMKKAAPLASMTPMGAMARGMGGAVAAQAASAAASAAAMSAQQQAMSQLAGFNNEIKSKDDVTVQYQLVATGQTTAVVQNTLQGKAKSDGEDVLTPLLQQTANTVLTQVTTKK